MSVSRLLRFEVFRRDGYTCFYCGRRAPTVILEADHKTPRSAGGPDTIDNLVTACWDCNRGKGPLPFEGREPEGWEDCCNSWEEWMVGRFDCEFWPDELPRWFMGSRGRRPVVFSYDVYDAAAKAVPAEAIHANTLDSILRRAESFTDCLLGAQ